MARRQRYIFADEPRRGRGFLFGFLVVLLILIAVLFTWNFALNHTVVYEEEHITIPNLPSSLENWTILHLSDLNGASIGENQSAIKKALGSRSFSCVVLSGNMVGQSGDVQPVLDLLSILPKGTPVLLLPGDSDPPLYAMQASSIISPYAPWAQTLIDAGVTILDVPVSFQRDRGTIWFIPANLYEIDLDHRETNLRSLLDEMNARVEPLTPDDLTKKLTYEYRLELVDTTRKAIAAIREQDVQIVVSAMPLTKEYIITSKATVPSSNAFSYHHASLVISGGYCAGQWRLPGGGAIWAPELGFFPEDVLITGTSYLNGVRQYISPGLGVSDLYPLLRFRMFNSPTATRLILSSSIK